LELAASSQEFLSLDILCSKEELRWKVLQKWEDHARRQLEWAVTSAEIFRVYREEVPSGCESLVTREAYEKLERVCCEELRRAGNPGRIPEVLRYAPRVAWMAKHPRDLSDEELHRFTPNIRHELIRKIAFFLLDPHCSKQR
jgi:hypothetical protein